MQYIRTQCQMKMKRNIMKKQILNTLIGSSISLLLPLSYASATETNSITSRLNNSIIGHTNEQFVQSAQNKLSAKNLIQTPSAEDDKEGQTFLPQYGFGVNILQRLGVTTQITPETSAIFGEQVSLSTGAVGFSQTDLTLPGNFDLPINITRTSLDPKARHNGTREFGLWNLDLPYISTTLIKSSDPGAIYSGSWGEGKACSGLITPASYHSIANSLPPWEFWNGDTLHIPGKGDSAINGTGTYPNWGKTTKNNWKIDCLKSSDNPEGYEGYIVTTDDGTIYTFSQLRLLSGKTIKKRWTNDSIFDRDGQCKERCDDFNQFHAFMMATKVQDRFGNWIKYHYSDPDSSTGPKRLLTKITASDNRLVDFTYDDNKISKIKTNGRAWTYNYNENITEPAVDYLTSITLPDARQWLFSGYSMALSTDNIPNDSAGDPKDPESYCIAMPRVNTFRMTHPSGIAGHFETANSRMGRTNVPKLPIGEALADGTINTYAIQRCFNVLALKTKTLTHPGGKVSQWHYGYSQNKGSFVNEPIFAIDDLASAKLPITTVADNGFSEDDLRSTTVMAPDGSKSVHYFVRRFDWLEGAEVYTDNFDTDGITRLSRQINHYQQGVKHGDYVSIGTWNSEIRWYNQLLKAKEIHQSGQIYTTEYSDFNAYEVPQVTTQSNNIEDSEKRVNKQTYQHDTNQWVLNLPRATQIQAAQGAAGEPDYTTVKETTYRYVSANNNGVSYNTLMPDQEKVFGLWRRKYVSFHADGNVNKVEFNDPIKNNSGIKTTINRYLSLSNYHRGTPKTIKAPSRYNSSGEFSVSRVVDNNGWVTKTTDFAGNVVNYYYDAMGQVIYVDNQAADVGDTKIEYILPKDGLGTKQVVTQGGTYNSGSYSGGLFRQTNQLDGLYRAVLTTTEDLSNASKVYQQTTYNDYGKPLTQSYPSVSNTAASLVNGSTFIYDGLQRKVSTTATGITGSQTTTYLSGNRIATKDYNDNTTTTTYLAFGAPQYDKATEIVSPDDLVTTTLAYNLFGNNTSITQSSTSGSQTQTNLYDNYQQLCKEVRNDVGNTAYSKNAVGQTVWQAQGASGSDTSCDAASVLASEKVTSVYDNLGDLWQTNYADNSADVLYIRDNQGNLLTLTAGGVQQAYSYNKAYQLTGETLNVDGNSWAIGYDYNRLGHLTELTFPGGEVVDYAPNGFGQPTKVGLYASGATYYPDGQLHSFTYGNGLVHTTTLNNRRLPEHITDIQGTVKAVDQKYTYDDQSNITSLTDNVNSAYSLSAMTYDGLDRLTGVTSKWGSDNSRAGSIDYDGFGNITEYKVGNTNLTYGYTNNRLDKVKNSAKVAVYDFAYDSRGNVTNNLLRSFHFNRANQLTCSGLGHEAACGAGTNSYLYDGHNRRVKAVDGNGTSYSLYSQGGTLLFKMKDGFYTNYIQLGKKLIARVEDGRSPAVSTGSSRQHNLPFGESVEGSKDDVGYAGHKFDTDLGLTYMQQRYYDPAIGRFYSNDPVGYINENPVMSFNRYLYVNNNPYKYTDPDGELLLQVFGAIVGGYTAASAAREAKGSELEVFVAGAVGAAVGALTGGIASAAVSKAAVAGVSGSAATAIESVAALVGGATTGAIVAGSTEAATQYALTGKVETASVAEATAKGGLAGIAGAAPTAMVGVATVTTEVLGTVTGGAAALALIDEK